VLSRLKIYIIGRNAFGLGVEVKADAGLRLLV